MTRVDRHEDSTSAQGARRLAFFLLGTLLAMGIAYAAGTFAGTAGAASEARQAYQRRSLQRRQRLEGSRLQAERRLREVLEARSECEASRQRLLADREPPEDRD